MEILKECKLPVCSISEQVDNPAALLELAAGAVRAGTQQRRVMQSLVILGIALYTWERCHRP